MVEAGGVQTQPGARLLTQIEKRFIDEMVAHARSDLPNECCGILAGRDGRVLKLYRMTNVEASPFRFSMDPGEVVKVDTETGDNGWELLAIYHSHTRSEAYPSDTDVRIAGGTAALWPDVRYVLVSLMDEDNPQVRLFSITEGAITEEQLDVI
jgi:proteasome lid subunit RPN8/RPN11